MFTLHFNATVTMKQNGRDRINPKNQSTVADEAYENGKADVQCCPAVYVMVVFCVREEANFNLGKNVMGLQNGTDAQMIS